MAIAAMSGQLNEDFAPDFYCPTAECRWAYQQSLAVCSQCTDVLNTSSLSCPSNDRLSNCTATTPKGFVLSLDPPFNSHSGFPGNGSLKGNTPYLANINIFRDNGQERNLLECELSLCVKAFHDTRAANGRITTGSTQEFALNPSGQDNYLVKVAKPAVSFEHWTAYDVFTVPDSATSFAGNRTFTVNTEDRRAVGSYLADLFAMNTTSQQVGLLRLLFNTPDISSKIHNVSLSMTNATPGGNGDVFRRETFIHVRWKWLILPLLVVVMAVVILVVSILRSVRHGTPAWKNSVLLLLFSRLDGWDSSDLVVSEPASLSRKAKTMSASIVEPDEGRGLEFVKSGK